LQNIPKNVDGDVFRRMVKTNVDFSRVHNIDFEFIFKFKKWAQFMARDAKEIFPHADIKIDEYETSGEEGLLYNVQVKLPMKPLFDYIIGMEQYLGKIAKRYHGRADAWGILQDYVVEPPEKK